MPQTKEILTVLRQIKFVQCICNNISVQLSVLSKISLQIILHTT